MTRPPEVRPSAADSVLPLAERQQTLRGREWLTAVKHTPSEKANPLGWYQRALRADGVTAGVTVTQLADANLSPSERAQIRGFTGRTFEATDPRIVAVALPADRNTSAPPSWSLMVEVEQRVVTYAGLLYRVLQIGDMRVPVGGVSGVATLPEWRGRGHARAVLAKTAAFVGVWLWAPFAVAICPRAETAFYRHIGWTVAEAPMWCDQPGGRVALTDEVAVYVSCQGDSTWPSGPIDVCGAPW